MQSFLKTKAMNCKLILYLTSFLLMVSASFARADSPFLQDCLHHKGYVGLSYTYTKYMPFGISADFKKSIAYIGIEAGVFDLTEHYQVKGSKTIVKPDFYAMIKPGLFFKYFSINCGFGTLQQQHSIDPYKISYYIGTSGNKIQIDRTVKTDSDGVGFTFRPELQGYIPFIFLDKNLLVSFGLGYNFIPKIEQLSGLTVTIGLNFEVGNQSK